MTLECEGATRIASSKASKRAPLDMSVCALIRLGPLFGFKFGMALRYSKANSQTSEVGTCLEALDEGVLNEGVLM